MVKYKDIIADCMERYLALDNKAIILGVGVTDHKGIFGTTLLANEKFPNRVIETPLSEFALTGACVGMALEGVRPILVHARSDFLTLSAEHIINTAAKWNDSHQTDRMKHVVIRSIIGRGWGQGPQHSQNLARMFQGIPGIEVHIPVNDAGYQRALDPYKPITIILEPRRLYDEEIPPLKCMSNVDALLLTYGDILLDALQVQKQMKAWHPGINVRVVPIQNISSQVLGVEHNQPRGIIFCESVPRSLSLNPELALQALNAGIPFERVNAPHSSIPTSEFLEERWYPGPQAIMDALTRILGIDHIDADQRQNTFTGPF